jgi:GxxExxY protein
VSHQVTKNTKNNFGVVDEALDRLAFAVIGAALEVHQCLGSGFLEKVYAEAMAVELALRRIAFEREVPISVDYKGQRIAQSRLDLVVCKRLVVELKHVDHLAPIHTAQVLSYLRATGARLALLFNFNVVLLQQGGIRRVIL